MATPPPEQGMAFPVANKTALVTGAGRGICLELTKLLLSKNCNVLLADLALTPEATEVVANSKGKAVFQETDVTDWAQLKAAFDAAITKFGGLEIVVPGAGVFEPAWSSFWHPKTSTSNQPSTIATIEINLTHPIKATQLAISAFQSLSTAAAFSPSQPKGAVILISSIAAQIPLFPYPIYAASKAAISSFVRSLAPLEPALGIRVAAVAPGIVKTPIWSAEKLLLVDEGKGDEWVTAESVAETIVKIIESNAFVGGSILEVGTEGLRDVKGLNDPGPTTKGCVVSGDPAKAIEGTWVAIGQEFGKL